MYYGLGKLGKKRNGLACGPRLASATCAQSPHHCSRDYLLLSCSVVTVVCCTYVCVQRQWEGATCVAALEAMIGPCKMHHICSNWPVKIPKLKFWFLLFSDSLFPALFYFIFSTCPIDFIPLLLHTLFSRTDSSTDKVCTVVEQTLTAP